MDYQYFSDARDGEIKSMFHAREYLERLTPHIELENMDASEFRRSNGLTKVLKIEVAFDGPVTTSIIEKLGQLESDCSKAYDACSMRAQYSSQNSYRLVCKPRGY